MYRNKSGMKTQEDYMCTLLWKNHAKERLEEYSTQRAATW